MTTNSIFDQGFSLIRLNRNTKIPIRGEFWNNPDFKTAPEIKFKGLNVGVKTGVKLRDGSFLAVLDIDPRNGGLQTLKHVFPDEGIELPETLTVKTGGGGYHYYFKTKTPIPCSKPFPGIDFKGVGGYVVGWNSIHESGKQYELLLDEPIAELPDALKKHVLKESKPFFDGKTGHFSEVEKVKPGERHNYLLSVAGFLRRAGLSSRAINSALQVVNQEKCDPPQSTNEVLAMARAVEKNYSPSDPLGFPTAELKNVVQKRKMDNAQQVENQFQKIYQKSYGLVREIAETILAHSDRQFPQFAIASALSIIAGAAQGGYSAPSIGNGEIGGGLNFYNWLIAPSAAGKDSYKHSVEVYLNEVDSRLVFDVFGSSYGLRCSLFCSNSGISVIDEFQDEMERLGGKQSSPHLQQVLTDMKKLTNDLSVLPAVTLAKSRYPAINNPRYSVFALGTMEGFNRSLTSKIIGGGLLSRFTPWPVLKVPSRIFSDRLRNPPPDQIKRLLEIARFGQTNEGLAQDLEEQIAIFQTVGEVRSGARIEHIQQWNPFACILKIEPAAKLRLHDFYAQQENEYFRFLAENEAGGDDISPGSVADRAPRLALKIACWAALGSGRVVVNENDIAWGVLVSKTLADWLCQKINRDAGDSGFEKLIKRIGSFFETLETGQIVNRRDIYSATGRNFKSFEMTAALEALTDSGKIQAVDVSGRPIETEGKLPTRGVKFMKGIK